MKVAIIGSRGIPARYGGFEVLAEKLAVGLAKEGHEVYVYGLDKLSEFDFNFPGVKRIFVKTPGIASLEKIWLSNYSALHSILKKVDAIIFLGVSAGLFMWVPRILFRKKIILNLDGLEWKRSRWNTLGKNFLKLLEALAVRWTDDIVADSMEIGKYVVTKYKKNFVYIPYGTDNCNFKDEDWEDIKKRFNLEPQSYYIVVGRHVPENNFDIIIKGFRNSNSSKKLVIVSNINSMESYSDKVIFTGPIYERPKLFALRKNAFAYIHGHSVGGTNPSLLEALGSKNIVLAYDVPFNREVLSQYGFYFKNEKNLANLINFIENNPDKIDRKKIFAYYDRILKEKYNWDIVVKKYKMLLERR